MNKIYNSVAGLDIHKKMVVCTVLKNLDKGLTKTTKEFKTFKKDLEKMSEWLADQEIELTAMESTSVYWYSVYEALEDKNITAIVVNAQHVKKVPGRKTDVSDSEWLAELCMCGLLRKSMIPNRDIRELRVISRYRKKIISMLVGEKCRLGKYLDATGIRLGCLVSDIDGVAAQRLIDALLKGTLSASTIALYIPKRARLKASYDELANSLEGRLSDRHRFVLTEIREHLNYLQEVLSRIDEQIVGGMAPYEKQWKLLQTVPGLNSLSAAVLLIETGADINQFASVEAFCSWAGICPGNNESAEKKSSRIRKANIYLKSTLCESAQAASRTNCQFKGYHESLKYKRGYKRATIAVAHKMMRIIYTMLKNDQPYQEPNVNYEELAVGRNAARWMRKLKEYGFLKAD